MKANDFISISNKTFDRTQIIVYDLNNNPYTVQIDNHFKRTEIIKLLTEICERAEYCKKSGLGFDYNVVLHILLIKHFTDIKFHEYKSIAQTFENEIKIANCLVNLEIIEQIIQKFPAAEMQRLQDIAGEFADFTKYAMNVQLDQMLENLKESEVDKIINDENTEEEIPIIDIDN